MRAFHALALFAGRAGFVDWAETPQASQYVNADFLGKRLECVKLASALNAKSGSKLHTLQTLRDIRTHFHFSDAQICWCCARK